MGKRQSSPPPPPDPAKTAAAQGAINKETAIAQARLNQIGEETPFGRSFYEPTGEKADGIDQYRRVTELAPEEQQRLDTERQIASRLLGIGGQQIERVGQNFSQPLDYSGLTPVASGADPRQAAEDAIYGRHASRLDPQFEQDQRRLETQLANQGFSRGTEAYGKAFDQFNRSKTDAYERAREAAILGGGQEASREQALNLQRRQQEIGEMLGLRSQPINELAVLLGTAPQVSSPSFAPIPTTGIAPADVTGPTALAYQGQLSAAQNAQNASNSFWNSLMGLGGSLGSAAIFSSDPAMKTDRAPADKASILEMVKDVDTETWRYKPGTGMPQDKRIGPMADDWAETFGGDGKGIPMPQMMGVSLAAIQELAKRMDRLEGRG